MQTAEMNVKKNESSTVNEACADDILYWAIRDTILGPLMIAATECGVAFIKWGETADLHEELRQHFPFAERVPAPPSMAPLLEEVLGCVEGRTANGSPPLPLDLRGSLFQEKVWRTLMTIPAGQTASYAEIALKVDQPGAARAVASACAANVLAVVIPCHRVVRASGALSGYRWGVNRKRALLAREREEFPVVTGT